MEIHKVAVLSLIIPSILLASPSRSVACGGDITDAILNGFYAFQGAVPPYKVTSASVGFAPEKISGTVELDGEKLSRQILWGLQVSDENDKISADMSQNFSVGVSGTQDFGTVALGAENFQEGSPFIAKGKKVDNLQQKLCGAKAGEGRFTLKEVELQVNDGDVEKLYQSIKKSLETSGKIQEVSIRAQDKGKATEVFLKESIRQQIKYEAVENFRKNNQRLNATITEAEVSYTGATLSSSMSSMCGGPGPISFKFLISCNSDKTSPSSKEEVVDSENAVGTAQ